MPDQRATIARPTNRKKCKLPSGHTGSYAVVGALALYLDFINLFLMMLRFMGHRRD
jgi:FtsH-binding integral membrane protein